jgi:amino acid transporter
MSGDGQRGPGRGGATDRGRPGAGQARQHAGGDSPPGDGQDRAGTPRPDALIPALDQGQLAALREVGREWDRVCADPQVWRQALPVDPSLGEHPEASEVRPGLFTRFVPVAGRDGQLPPIQTTNVSETPLTPLGRAGQALKRLVVGPPLDASAIAAERMRKLVALPVLSADALSSVAYGPQAILAVLVLAGLPGLSYSLPVGAAIVVLMLAVGVSYRQTIRAYPQGGGSYIVASEELGRVPGLMAAAGLLIDYVMTVAVSIASGVAAITSAYPSMQPATVWIGVGVIVILLAGNLRGVRQAGSLFAVPTYAFIAAMAALVIAGLVHAAGHGFHPVPARHLAIVQAVTVLLVLRAFASGATAMTGIEAISNAVPSFKPAEWRNARITLSWMTGLLIGMFAGVLVITRLAGIVPVASQTMLSQLAHLSFGDGPAYVYIQAATAAVLLMAANTSYNDFPRVLFLMARDQQAPRSFLHIGDRLTFSEGILLLSVTSAAIYIAFRGNTESLLPLYAVGVFLAFTLSQTGMIMHWRRHRDQPHWRRSLAFNATGAVLSGIVFIIEGVTKFTAGAWVSLVLIAAIIATALHTRRYYIRTGRQLALSVEDAAAPAPLPAKLAPRPPSSRPARGPEGGAAAEGAEQPGQINALTIVPVEVMDRAGLQALAYAAALGQPAFALHISPTAEEADRFLGYWRAWGDHLPLEVIVSPHRAVVAPLVNYLWTLHEQRPDLILTAVVPELVDRHWWHRILYEPVAGRLQRALKSLPRVVVTSVPFHLAD